jgi:excisionase family DNA binding protein
MALVTVSEAAKLVSRDRKTLYRLIKEGKLSATVRDSGSRQVETSELLRVFGEMRQSEVSRDSRETVSMSQHETPDETVATGLRLAVLEAELRHAKELLAAKDDQIADLRQLVRLLPAPEPRSLEKAQQSIWTRPLKWPWGN